MSRRARNLQSLVEQIKGSKSRVPSAKISALLLLFRQPLQRSASLLPVSSQIRVTNLTRAVVATRSFLSSLLPLSHHEIFVVDCSGFFPVPPGGVGRKNQRAEKSDLNVMSLCSFPATTEATTRVLAIGSARFPSLTPIQWSRETQVLFFRLSGARPPKIQRNASV